MRGDRGSAAQTADSGQVPVYEGLVAIDHTADHCIYPAGARFRLDHLTPEKIKMLIDRGYVRPVAPVEPPDEL